MAKKIQIFDVLREGFSRREQSPKSDGQVLEQVWFAGVHSNVGGSYPQTGLSDIALLWMMAKAEACGLAIDRNRMAAVNHPQPDACGRTAKP